MRGLGSRKGVPMKKVVSLSLVLFLCVAAFAQNPPRVLAQKDIDAFVANFAAINADIDALGDKYDEFFDSGDEDASLEKFYAAIHSTKVPAEVAAIFRKYGLGDNGFEKAMVISVGFSALESEGTLNRQIEESGMDGAEFREAFDWIASIKTTLHKDDLALVGSNRDALRATMVVEDGAGGYSDEADYMDGDEYGDYGDYAE